MTLNLEAIKARCERAMPGPYMVCLSRFDGITMMQPLTHVIPSVTLEGEYWPRGYKPPTDPYGYFVPNDHADISAVKLATAEMLANAATDLPALVAEVERLKTAMEEHKQARFEMFDQLSDAESREGEALRILRAAVDWFDGEINAPWYAEACKLVAKADDERAAESITVPPNRTGTPEESQAIADWHHDEITRRAAESKAAKEQP